MACLVTLKLSGSFVLYCRLAASYKARFSPDLLFDSSLMLVSSCLVTEPIPEWSSRSGIGVNYLFFIFLLGDSANSMGVLSV